MPLSSKPSWVERAREFILTRTVPPTDAQCDFSWSRLRCEPKCACGARLRFGDYTPGRACRLLHAWERSPSCEMAWDPSDEPALARLTTAARSALSAARRVYETRVAPPTDDECSFSFQTGRCEPRGLCRLRWRVRKTQCFFGFCRGSVEIHSMFTRGSPEALMICTMAPGTAAQGQPVGATTVSRFSLKVDQQPTKQGEHYVTIFMKRFQNIRVFVGCRFSVHQSMKLFFRP